MRYPVEIGRLDLENFNANLGDEWTVSGIRETKKTDKKKIRKGPEFSTLSLIHI